MSLTSWFNWRTELAFTATFASIVGTRKTAAVFGERCIVEAVAIIAYATSLTKWTFLMPSL